MNIEIKQKSKESKERKYPWLGISVNGTIVLFTDKSRGIVLFNAAYLVLGSYSTDWDMEKFTDFEGEITLSNEDGA